MAQLPRMQCSVANSNFFFQQKPLLTENIQQETQYITKKLTFNKSSTFERCSSI